MRTINIKGKEYVPVTERVKHFKENYPEYTLLTEIVSMDDTSVTMKATVYDKEGRAVATGHANEERGSSNINKTSYVENCETSCIGRALGMLGIGIDGAMASAEEVENAIMQQEALKAKVNKNHISALRMLAEEKNSDFDKILSHYELEKAEDMTFEQWNNAMKLLNMKKS